MCPQPWWNRLVPERSRKSTKRENSRGCICQQLLLKSSAWEISVFLFPGEILDWLPAVTLLSLLSLQSKQGSTQVLVGLGGQAVYPQLLPQPLRGSIHWLKWLEGGAGPLIKMKNETCICYPHLYIYLIFFILITSSLSLSWKLTFSTCEILWKHSAPFHNTLELFLFSE